MADSKGTAQGKSTRPSGNRRAYPRIPTTFEVRYAEGRNAMKTGIPMEIGEGGLSIETEDLLPLESTVNVEFKMGDSKDWVKVKGVVRHSEGHKLGIEFLNLRLHDRLKIVDAMSVKKQ